MPPVFVLPDALLEVLTFVVLGILADVWFFVVLGILCEIVVMFWGALIEVCTVVFAVFMFPCALLEVATLDGATALMLPEA